MWRRWLPTRCRGSARGSEAYTPSLRFPMSCSACRNHLTFIAISSVFISTTRSHRGTNLFQALRCGINAKRSGITQTNTMPAATLNSQATNRAHETALDALRSHWPEYLIEAAALGAFMISACVFTVLLEHP